MSDENQKPLSLIQVMGSTLMAGLGIQKSENRERDFSRGDIKTFIAAGIILTLGFLGVLVTIVQIVLSQAT